VLCIQALTSGCQSCCASCVASGVRLCRHLQLHTTSRPQLLRLLLLPGGTTSNSPPSLPAWLLEGWCEGSSLRVVCALCVVASLWSRGLCVR
jgi:hypothetical protein